MTGPLNLREQIVHQIGRKIASGEIEPGSVLPKEHDLAIQLGVSRTIIREALKSLGARGLIKSKSRVGATVQARSNWQMLDPDVLAWAASTDESGSLKIAIRDARLLIEPDVAALAADRAEADKITRIRALYDNLAKSTSSQLQWDVAILKFHRAVAVSAENEILVHLVVNLVQATPASKITPELLPFYDKVVTAIAAGDSELARTSMKTLIIAHAAL